MTCLKYERSATVMRIVVMPLADTRTTPEASTQARPPANGAGPAGLTRLK